MKKLIIIFALLGLTSCATGYKLQGEKSGIGTPEMYLDNKNGIVCYQTTPLFWPLPIGQNAVISCVEIKK